jgi:hypothetical protein
VTTEVFPSEMGDGIIPWWVWLLAALGGLLLLALICFVLYKVNTKQRMHMVNFKMVCVVNMSKIDKFLNVEKFGVQAYAVNLIQLCTALALASDHPQKWQTYF